jgi:formylglycine-generating enzyme
MGTGDVTRRKRLLLLVGGIAALGAVVTFAVHRRSGPRHCGSGWVNAGARCCAPGQSMANGHCVGTPNQCPPGFHPSTSEAAGCVFDARRVRVGPTALKVGPNDWQSEQVPRVDRQVGALLVDATEVDGERWRACAAAHRCAPRSIVEPGQPITQVTPDQARSFCAAAGGRLPTLEERTAVAAGNESRRYPWGQTGLVCRRAVFGVTSGPCADKGTGPDVVGSHPDGQSPEGVLDLSGNVAELAVDDQQRTWACGGSFRSKTALELKSWTCSLFMGPSDDVGFRCVYD